MDGFCLIDIDECSVHPSLCRNGGCINTIGSFICRCHPGYLLVRNTCVDVNECAGNAGRQLCDQVCINTPGSYRCSCHKGYTLLSGGGAKEEQGAASLCVDVDECSLGSCSHSCSNHAGGFVCHCPQGMALHHDGRTCIPHRSGYDDDDDDDDYVDWSRHNVAYDMSSHISTGLTSTTNQNNPPIQEHISQLSYNSRFLGLDVPIGAQPCSDKCLNGGTCLNGYCICPVGITGESCEEDIDECLSLPSSMSCSHDCSNTFGSYECSCPQGHVLSGDQRTCLPLGCIPTCLNGGSCDDSSGKCNCSSGYTGKACDLDVNECEEAGSGALCQHLCQNTLGSFSCVCLGRGKTLGPDKRSCVMAPEYSICFPACRNGGTCKQMLGGQIYCHCPSGFKGRFCQIDVNECAMNSSLCSHICVNLRGGYQCLCPPGLRAVAVNGGRTECVLSNDLEHPSSISEPTDSDYVQAYQFTLKEDTHFKGNESKEIVELAGDSAFHSFKDDYHGSNNTLKVLIEIIVSTTSHPNCTSENSLLIGAPSLITKNSKYETEYVANYLAAVDSKGNSSQIDVRSVLRATSKNTQDPNLVQSTATNADLYHVENLISSFQFKSHAPESPLGYSMEELIVGEGNGQRNLGSSAFLDQIVSFRQSSSVSSNLASSEDLVSDKVSLASIVVASDVTPHENRNLSSINVDPLGETRNIEDISPTRVQRPTTFDDIDSLLVESAVLDVTDFVAEVTESDLWENQTPVISIPLSTTITSLSSGNFSLALHSLSNLSSPESVNSTHKGISVRNDDELDLSFNNASDVPHIVSSFIGGGNRQNLDGDKMKMKDNTNVSASKSNSSDDTLVLKIKVTSVGGDVKCSVENVLNVEGGSLSDGDGRGADCLSNQLFDDISQGQNIISNISLEHNGKSLDSENEISPVGVKNISESSHSILDVSHGSISESIPHPTAIPDPSPIPSLTAPNGTLSSVSENVTVSHGEKVKKIGKPETKNEKPSGRKHKSKKGKKNRRKGRKVLRLTQNFEVVNQFSLPSDDIDENPFPVAEGATSDNDFGASASSGSRYFELLDYGDEDYDWSTKKFESFPEVSSSQPVLPLPPPSPSRPKTLQPLEFAWKSLPENKTELECLFNGKRFPSRSKFFRDERNCTQCTCKDGELRCAPRHCPPPHCEEPIEGDCCEYCPGDCLFGQQVFLPGERFSPPLDPCRECRCEKGGRVLCRDVVCPPLDCDAEFRAVMPGECCPACLSPEPGCFHRGRFFYEGQLWVRQEGGCHACLCKGDGEVQCNPVVCVVNCQHPQFVTGECCPLCSGCQYYSHKYQDHEVFPHPADECSLCQCQQGNITCFHKPCDQNCSYPLKKSPDGCCPECKDCLFNGFRMKNGSSLIRHSQDSCEDCTCMGGEVHCQESPCVNECVLESRTWPSGAEFSPGHDPCTDCRCWDGNITCQAVACPKEGPASCSHGILLPGSCCLNCEKCDYRGKLYDNAEVFAPEGESCTHCTCLQGNVVCEVKCDDEQQKVGEDDL
ncbi:uncharacterized protein LOC124154711 isoform X2 [Ischnura elegans]|uniref:uncharacterized protein LOC124154711 isoform X2 n=1 Tax=Ischnura elegans TaxID=197161 RepID=UPI001ED88EA4|nr:uncharacterized protein LOC124154711 isoform X2 [Ischnura elegans]